MASPSPLTVSINPSVSCRLYSDTRPHCLEIAQLQKGLVLIQDGIELVEEGIGFGAPVVIYEDRPYFSTTAETSIQQENDRKVLVKSFTLDAISRKQVAKTFYINDDFYKFFHERFHRTYTNNKKLTPAFNRVMDLRRIFRVKTEFVKVKPRGKATFRYKFNKESIDVEVSLHQLDKARCKQVLILNEQGASFFRIYQDSDGLTLVDDKVGAMEKVRAERALFATKNGALSFSLRKITPASFFRGREKTNGRFSWAGFDYSLPPETSVFRYDIQLRARKKKLKPH